jgi:hypothetical protein
MSKRQQMWSQRIQDFRNSGQTQAASSHLQWVRVQVVEAAAPEEQEILRITFGSASVEVKPGFTPSFLADVVRKHGFAEVDWRLGGALHEMSTEVRQELKIIPAQAKVVKHVRHVYACRHCERHETETPIVTAPMPNPVYPGSLASPSALAYILHQKYV